MPNQYTPNDDLIPTISAIYQIRNTINGKFYLGSSNNVYMRWNEHRSELRRGTHHSITLQRSWNKYTEAAFVFEIIEYVLSPFLIEREQYHLDKLKPYDPRKGYNIAKFAQSNHKGLTHSPEARIKIGMASCGRVTSPETKAKISQSQLGRKRSPESIEKRTQSRIGFKHTPETKAKLRTASLGNTNMMGKSPSLETREKLRDWNKGRMKMLIVTSPDGLEFTVTGIHQFCKEHHLDRSNLLHVAKGNKKSHKGWRARFPD